MENKVCIGSEIVEGVKAMKERAVLTQIQALGDFLNEKFTDFQYEAVTKSMETVINECNNILDVLSVENGCSYIICDFLPKAEKMALAVSALARVA